MSIERAETTSSCRRVASTLIDRACKRASSYDAAVQPQVTFRSSRFNTSQPRAHFINPDCFGDDVATWIIGELRARSIEVDAEAGQEDFGWYVRYRVTGMAHCFVLSLMPAEDGATAQWAGWFERDAGALATLLGG